MKKFMKLLLITGVCASIMVSGFAFADTETLTKTSPGGKGGQRGEGKPGHERMTEEEREAKDAEHAEKQAELLNIVDTYASDLSDDFNDAFIKAEELRTEMHTLKEANKPSDEEHEAMKAQMESIREKVENGELTREEAREEMDSNRPERPDHGGDKEESTQEEHEALKAEKEAKHDVFQAAVEEGDEDTIIEHLEEMLSHIQERNADLAEKIANL